eukprot:TRINITY_DN1193_c0_g1_i2.p1 TRINITY_DN1193_c0_g1~~TRINITY_DN1193_c0_g1_i2.p1  ORF type:complete len:112 (+),score=27.17 TRINITY_DN1193_c0_g1_i2:278-613(+)
MKKLWEENKDNVKTKIIPAYIEGYERPAAENQGEPEPLQKLETSKGAEEKKPAYINLLEEEMKQHSEDEALKSSGCCNIWTALKITFAIIIVLLAIYIGKIVLKSNKFGTS